MPLFEKEGRKRDAGILLPVFSLPSAYGIGSLSKEAYDFVDFLAAAGQTYWQVLPLGPTSYGDSPYQSFSTFAGNPYFIDIDGLISEGWLTKEEASEQSFGSDPAVVDYEKLYNNRFKLLRKAFERIGLSEKSACSPDRSLTEDFERFVRDNRDWLADYALFMSLKNAHGGSPWQEWEEGLRFRHEAPLKEAEEKYKEDITFTCFQQYVFNRQWHALKAYAGEKGISIIGDVPIYVAYDSADTWSDHRLFQFNADGTPKAVAGCPPDAFATTGQLWGNPLYDWEYHEKTGFSWWIWRLRHCFEMVDVLRVDHFRGFDEYYSVPYKDPTAENGTWEKGPGKALFEKIREELGNRPIIAEDLGFVTPSVRELIAYTGLPGMKVLQFGFDSGADNEYLPHNYVPDTVVYTGTHDNDTTAGWFKNLNVHDRDHVLEYLGVSRPDDVPYALIRAALSSVSGTAVIPMQDYLELGSEARINTPSIPAGNWTWRMKKGVLTDELAAKIRSLTTMYGR